MQNKWGLTWLVLGLASLTSCAQSKVERDLDERLQSAVRSEPWEDAPDHARTRAAQRRIETDDSLSADQRAQLQALRKQTASDLRTLRQQGSLLRGMLVDEVLAQPYSDERVSAIEGRLEQLNRQQSSTLSASLKEANRILGRDATRHARALREMVDPMRNWGFP